jgi:hypothetical protein
MENAKKVISWIFLLLLSGAVNPLAAQLTKDENLSRYDERPIHFGFYLGINTMDYRFTHFGNVYENPVLNDPVLAEKAASYYNGVNQYYVECYPLNPGFTVGGVLNLRMNTVIDFRCTPGMSLGSRQLKFSDNIDPYIRDQKVGGRLYSGLNYDRYMTTPSAYIDLPVGFRYKGSRFGNLRPYIYGGAAYRRDLESKRISESVIHLKRNGYYAEIGFGLDTYFPYFRFTSEFKFSYGLNNILMHDADISSATPLPYYGYMLKELNSNIFTLIVFFE